MRFRHFRFAAAFLVAACSADSFAHAQTSDAEIIAELIGAPVFSSDGQAVGTVRRVFTSKDGEVASVSMNAARILGLGERELTLPHASFIVLRGAVVMHLPAEAVEGLLPETATQP